MYRHALEISPLHSNTLYNFAVMLDTHCSRKDEAEELYRQAIAVEVIDMLTYRHIFNY